MFPYKDDNPTVRTPIMTFVLIGLNVLVWLLVQGAGTEPMLEGSVCRLGLVPGHLFGSIPPGSLVPLGGGRDCVVGGLPGWATILTSMFAHGGWLHILGNMWFMWVFGNNVEDSMGRFRFLLFYLLCGTAAALTQGFSNPGSAVPMIGASGAISGVMGAYIVLYPRVKVHMLIFLGIFITTLTVPAYLMLAYWFLLQILGGVLPVLSPAVGGTAFLAHVGGFVAGMVLALLFRNRTMIERRNRVQMA